jgi:glycosyltransferase involved in cell wall biosynthesis
MRLGTVKLPRINSTSITQRTVSSIIACLKSREKFDFITIGFYAHLIMFSIGILSHPPILLDIFLSTFDTLCYDRKLCKPKSLLGLLAYYLDYFSCKWANFILLDTNAHINYFVDTFNLSIKKFTAIPVGCNEDIFYPRKIVNKKSQDFIVLYYSTYLPLHGVDIVIRAAKELAQIKDIKFRLIGKGPTFYKINEMVKYLGLKNVELIPQLPIHKLAIEIAEADICLGGHFGKSDKAKRVIPGKIYQILASEKPLIAADTIANRELLIHGENAILCPARDFQKLAEMIRMLYENRNTMIEIAKAGRQLYYEKCSELVITEKIKNIIQTEILL